MRWGCFSIQVRRPPRTRSCAYTTKKNHSSLQVASPRSSPPCYLCLGMSSVVSSCSSTSTSTDPLQDVLQEHPADTPVTTSFLTAGQPGHFAPHRSTVSRDARHLFDINLNASEWRSGLGSDDSGHIPSTPASVSHLSVTADHSWVNSLVHAQTTSSSRNVSPSPWTQGTHLSLLGSSVSSDLRGNMPSPSPLRLATDGQPPSIHPTRNIHAAYMQLQRDHELVQRELQVKIVELRTLQ